MKSKCKNCNTEFNYMPSQKNGIYCSNKCQGEHTVKQRFVKGSKFRNTMRKYLVEHRDYHCEVCGITEHNGKPITLQVDHIDGDRENNTFENLRFICPNCHSQTETWGIGNMSEEGRLKLKTNRCGSSVG
jgi:5-methylcytosine-specific restriction endonuclease McrA